LIPRGLSEKYISEYVTLPVAAVEEYVQYNDRRASISDDGVYSII